MSTLANTFLNDFDDDGFGAEEIGIGSSYSTSTATSTLNGTTVKAESSSSSDIAATKAEVPPIKSVLLQSNDLQVFLSSLQPQAETDKAALVKRNQELSVVADKIINAVKKEKSEESKTKREQGSGTDSSDSSDSDSDSDSDSSSSSDSDSDSNDDEDDDDGLTKPLRERTTEELGDMEEGVMTINKANELIRKIDEETRSLQKRVSDIYTSRFPKLEEFVASPLEYAKCILAVGDCVDSATIEARLKPILPASTVFTITVTAVATAGKPLEPHVQQVVEEGCREILQLAESRSALTDFIEGRLAVIAPNLSNLLGTSIAAQLLGATNGLEKLVTIAACNLQVIGAERRHHTGMSRSQLNLNSGLLKNAEPVQSAPLHLRMKALSFLANKVALAARFDYDERNQSGDYGRKLLADVQAKIRKWSEPPPMKLVRALPKPMEQKRIRRGGRKARKIKEMYKQTELQKQQNRMLFGEAEITDDYTGEGMGLIGQQGAGILRIQKSDKAGQTHKISRKMQEKLNRMKQSGRNPFANAAAMGGAATSGTLTSTSTSSGGIGSRVDGMTSTLAGTVTSLAGTATSLAGISTSISGLRTGLGSANGRGGGAVAGGPGLGPVGGDYFAPTTGFAMVRKADGDAREEIKKPKPEVPKF